MQNKLKLYGFNNLTKALSFNIYDVCYAKTEREQREALRREFSANVSHELKTPLTSITGFAELMKEGMVPKEKMQEFSGDIYRESRRLIDLVDDIIQLSRLDEGTANFSKSPVDLYTLSGQVIESLRPVAQKQDITLTLSGQHAVIEGVEQLLQEMVYNLAWEQLIMDNSLKPGFDRMGMTVSEAEQLDMLDGVYLSPVVTSTFVNPSTGLFDPHFMKSFMSSVT